MSATMTAPSPPSPVDVDHLAALEAEAVHIIREVLAELDRPVLLFSGGKDSAEHRQLGGAGCG